MVPGYEPVGVFPYDPDNNFKRGRKWETQTHKFSPILEQRFVIASNPLISFEIGFSVLKGSLADPTTKPGALWQFFNACQGQAVSFWYYDPVPWSTMPEPYRDSPTSRLTHPTQATLGRYIALFDEAEMSAELFEYKLLKSLLKISGFPG
jgi:hypothetical protein